jgi:ABC-type sugar transport system ATPase subunit
MIALDNVTVRAGSFVLEGINLRVPLGQHAALMGRTGSGKTTVLEAICGLRTVTSGRIFLRETEVTHLKPAERGLGYVPQDRALFPSMTVAEHLAFALAIRKWPDDAIERRIADLAELLGLEHLMNRRPHGLSGGEAQRVALGRALAFQPQVLLLDEPLSALDEETRAEMYGLLKSVRERTGVTTLHVTHNIHEAHRLADMVFLIRDGKIREESLQERKQEAGGVVP